METRIERRPDSCTNAYNTDMFLFVNTWMESEESRRERERKKASIILELQSMCPCVPRDLHVSMCTVTCFLSKRKLHQGFFNACNLMEATLRVFFLYRSQQQCVCVCVHNLMAGRMPVISWKAVVKSKTLYGRLYVFKKIGSYLQQKQQQ